MTDMIEMVDKQLKVKGKGLIGVCCPVCNRVYRNKKESLDCCSDKHKRNLIVRCYRCGNTIGISTVKIDSNILCYTCYLNE